MQFPRSSARWLLLFWTAVPGLLSAQSGRPLPPAHTAIPQFAVHPAKRQSPRVLSPDEGLAILGAALESRGPGRRAEARSDCSHLVHRIYEKAGFPYTYMSSSDFYTGTEEFQRVAQPQPGDLVVWRGHAGIVVNPRQHTFFSALRSGFGVESYDSAYWMGRGHPHFLRYVKRTPASVMASSSRAVSLKPTGMHGSGSVDTMPPKTGHSSENEESEDDSAPRLEAPSVSSVPGLVVVKSSKPSPEQVRAALLAGFREAAAALQGQDVFKLPSPLISFDNFKILRIQRQGDQGWAELQISGPDPIVGRSTRLKKVAQRQHWSLRRRNADTWELLLPKDALYLPRDLAVRVLAHQLATLSQAGSVAAGDHDKQAQLARWLDVLLDDSRSH
jgi:hypothetical protein